MTILLTIAAVYLGLLLVMFLMQRQMIFLPDRNVDRTPADLGLEWQEARFETADGVELHGWYLPNPSSEKVLLFSHGNAGNISYRLELLELFHRHGFSTFIYDYRGYGESRGRPGEKGLYRDIRAAWNHLVEEYAYQPDRIVLYGRSLGGAVSAHLARDVEPAALILDSSFTSARDVAAEIYPFVPPFMVRFNLNTMEYLRQVAAPVLVMHSPDDEIIGFSHGQRLHEVAGEPKRFVELRGAHNDNISATGSRYFEEIRSFLEEVSASDP